MKDVYTAEELKKMGRYIGEEVESFDYVEVKSTMNCKGWLIFIPDKDEEKLIETSLSMVRGLK